MEGKNRKVKLNLRKARSHIKRIMIMIDEGEYCIDIIQQMNAVIGYLNSAKNMTLKEHLNCCFAENIDTANPEERLKLISEVMYVSKMTH